jgi:DNA polymerase alpha subunit B
LNGIVSKGDEAIETDQINGGKRTSGRYAKWTPVGLPRQKSVLCMGRICNEAHRGRLNSGSILLEGSRAHSFGCRIKLDLGGILDNPWNHQDGSVGRGYSLFPGQIVAVEGNNPLGGSMIVSRVIKGIHPQCKTSNECHMSVDDDRSFSVWAACGPYTSSDDLEYDPLLDLIERVVSDVPDVVILCGPFVDAQQSLAIGENGIGPSIVDDNGGDVSLGGGRSVVTSETVFRLKVSSLLAEMYEYNPESRTQFVLVPSLDDAFVDAVYPQAPFVRSGDGRDGRFCDLGLRDVEMTGPVGIRTGESQRRVHLPSNPCTLQIGHVMVGVTSTGVLFHLASEGCDGGIPLGSRLARLAGHLVGQGSYYPIFPAPTSMTLDMTKSKEWEIPGMLDVLIVPSRLSPFARVAAYGNGSTGTTLVVNPGMLTKGSSGGTYSRINIRGSKREEHGAKDNNILDRISVVIMHI